MLLLFMERGNERGKLKDDDNNNNNNNKTKKQQQQLSINYEASIANNATGFFQSGYIQNGVQKYVYATQFEPVYARMAMPCFDEPAFKATFSLSVNMRNSDMAGATNFAVLSNMDLQSVAPGFDGKTVRKMDGRRTLSTNSDSTIRISQSEYISHQTILRRSSQLYTFQTTPPMSTYTFGWAMGDFAESVYNSTLTGVSYRIWSVQALQGQGYMALSMADYCTNFYNTYFGIAYPFRKMDLVALPK